MIIIAYYSYLWFIIALGFLTAIIIILFNHFKILKIILFINFLAVASFKKPALQHSFTIVKSLYKIYIKIYKITE